MENSGEGKDLDCHATIERKLARFIDDAHSAMANFLDQAIIAKLLIVEQYVVAVCRVTCIQLVGG